MAVLELSIKVPFVTRTSLGVDRQRPVRDVNCWPTVLFRMILFCTPSPISEALNDENSDSRTLMVVLQFHGRGG